MEDTVVSIVSSRTVDEMIRRLPQLATGEPVEQGVLVAAHLLADQTSANAPKLTGKTARSVKVHNLGSRGNRSAAIVEINEEDIGEEGFYPQWQEFGWLHGSRRTRRWSASRVTVDKAGNIRHSRKPRPPERRKKIPGKHYMRNALRDRGQMAADLAAMQIWKAIESRVANSAS